jgi:hypothetical protein
MAKARLLDLLRLRNAEFSGDRAPASLLPPARVRGIPFSDDQWRADALHREALDAISARRRWHVLIQPDNQELFLLGTNAEVIARALAIFPRPQSILVQPCRGRDSARLRPIPLGEDSHA